jgi:hypothetical protein
MECCAVAMARQARDTDRRTIFLASDAPNAFPGLLRVLVGIEKSIGGS